jgi:hypothetical protein
MHSSTRSLLTLPDINDLQDPFYLLDPALPERSVVLVHGHPGLGKSTLVLGWLMSLAHGQPWLGRNGQTGEVVNVWAEGHYGDVKKRHWAALQELACKPSSNYLWHPEPVNLFRSDSVDRFMADLEWQQVSPIVISFDSFHICSAGADENEAKDMGLVLESINRLRDTYNCSIVLVHHSRKDGETERGSTSLKAAVDVQIAVKGSDRNPKVIVKSEKVRGGAPFSLTLYRRVSRTPWGTTVTMSDQDPAKSQDTGVPEALMGRQLFTTKEFRSLVPLSRTSAFRKLQELTEKGLILRTQRGVWTIVSPTSSLRKGEL